MVFRLSSLGSERPVFTLGLGRLCFLVHLLWYILVYKYFYFEALADCFQFDSRAMAATCNAMASSQHRLMRRIRSGPHYKWASMISIVAVFSAVEGQVAKPLHDAVPTTVG